MSLSPIFIKSLTNEERHFVYGASRIALCQERNGALGREYLINKRKIDIETIANFRLGFVPFERNHHFSGRIVFPIFNLYDELIALSVRPIREEDEKKQKYWNESFPKGEHLFGLNLACYEIPKLKKSFVVIVEGQMDVLKMHSCGIKNTVGILGGGFTFLHAVLLSGWTNNFVFIMDGDSAGENHALSAIETLSVFSTYRKGGGINTYKVTLPKGEDPDSFLDQYGGCGMMSLIRKSLNKI